MTAEHLFAGYSAAQVREAERPLLEPGEPLMARAAAGLAEVVRTVLAERRGGRRRLLVLAGSGNNGGDALYAVAELLRDGGSATVVPLGSRMHEAGLAAARSAGAAVLPAAPVGEVLALARCADVILDGILGTGAAASPALRPPASDLVAALIPLATDGVPVVAVDLPSGLGPDDGSVNGPVLPAAVTVTFGAVKAGLLLPPGRDLAGEVRLVDIGLGPRLADVEPVVRP